MRILCYVYALAGPDGIRYVGQTRRDPETRLKGHLRFAFERGSQTHCQRWIRTLSEKPTVIVLERCTADVLNERELYWIQHLRELGLNLCNHQDSVLENPVEAGRKGGYKLGWKQGHTPTARAKAAESNRRRWAAYSSEERKAVTDAMRAGVAAKSTPESRGEARRRSWETRRQKASS